MTFRKLTIVFAVMATLVLGIIGAGQFRTAEAAKTVLLLPADKLAPLLAEAKVDITKPYTAVINVWATWCGPCLREIPSLNQIVANAKGKNIKFIGVTSEDAAMVTEFLVARKSKFTFDYNVLSSAKLAEGLPALYGQTRGERVPDAIPMHFIIKNNEVLYFHLGGLTPSDQAEMIKVLGLKGNSKRISIKF